MNAANTFNPPGSRSIRALQNPITSIGLAVLCLVVDFFIGPHIVFPVLFILPVIVSAWYCRPHYAYFLAIVQPLIRFGFQFYWPIRSTVSDSIINTAIRVIVFLLFAYFVNRAARQTREMTERVNLLEGILPICNLCKKIQDEHGDWQPVEVYVSNRSAASFNQSLCPDCLKRDYRNPLREG